MAFTPTDPTKAEVRVTGTAPNQSLDFYIPRGAKGEPGGFTAGTSLGTLDLNSVVVDGIYRQNGPANATLLNNYPVAGVLGILHVHQESTDSWMRQTFYPNGYAGQGRVFYQRVRSGSQTWGPWRSYGSTRVDQTAGRAIYQWDDVNSREQIIYGDTGWRDVSAQADAAVTSVKYRLRRSNQHVQFVWDARAVVGNADTVIYTLPAGFRHMGDSRFGVGIELTTGAARLVTSNSGGDVMAVRNMSTNSTYGSFSWITADAWPTTLPGTSAGTIPNL